MKKSELKELIKPIVKECVEESVREVLLESGLLSAVISEVLKGTGTVIRETVTENKKQPQFSESEAVLAAKAERQAMLQEMKQKSLSMKVGGVDVFRGTKPAQVEPVSAGPGDPLGGVSPSDPGIDISRLFGGKKFNI